MKKQLVKLSLAAALVISASALAQNTFPFPSKGSVGIGTTDPTRLLDVNGEARINGWLELDAPPASAPRVQASRELFVQTSANQPLFLNAFNGGGNVIVGGAQGAAPNLAVRGNLGVGTDAPQTKLHVIGDTTIEGELVLPGNETSGSRLISNQNLHIQTLNNKPIFLNPFDGGGDVHVGKSLVVRGKVTSQSLELTSDRNQKKNFQPVFAADILAKVAALPITTWAYTNSPNIRHLGPMAQDFKGSFDLGEDDKHIGAGDGIGVALAAIKGLHELVQEKEARIAALEKELASHEKATSDRLAALEQVIMKRNVQQASFRPEIRR